MKKLGSKNATHQGTKANQAAHAGRAEHAARVAARREAREATPPGPQDVGDGRPPVRPAANLAVPVTDTDHAQGAVGAPVTLVEYGDYQCRSCGQAYPVVKAMQAELGDGLRFVFRNFPLDAMHAHAEHAAEAAEAAGAQGGEAAFWAMHDALFEHQDALADPDLGEYAENIVFDMSRLVREVAGGAYAAHIRAQFEGGVRSGVDRAPTFFINDARYDGDWADAAAFAAALNAAVTANLSR